MSEELTRVGEGLFRVTRRGYDQAEVGAYIDQLQRRIHELQELHTPEGAVRDALDRVGGEVSGVLQQAHDAADQIIADAERDAQEHKQQATDHAAEIVAVAERRVRELDRDTDRIWAERERIVADARDLSTQMLNVAEQAAERFPSDPAEATPAASTAAPSGFQVAEAGFGERSAAD